MASRKKSGFLIYAIIIFAALFIGSWLLITNLFNVETFVKFGPAQYFSNVKNFHENSSFESFNNLLIYNKIIELTDGHEEQSIATINKGKVFQFRGYRTKEHSTWLAVKIYTGSDPIYGYVVIPGKFKMTSFWSQVNRFFSDSSYGQDGFFREFTYKERQDFRNNLNSRLIQKLQSNFNLKEANKNELQRIEDDNNLKLLDFLQTNKHYYIPAGDYEAASKLYDLYLGQNFQAHLYQMLPDYDPIHHGDITKSFFGKILSSKTFKFIIFIFFIIFISTFFKTKELCPKCKSKDIEQKERQLISQDYKFLNKSGKKDKRRKENPLISLYNVIMSCNKCSYKWNYEIKNEKIKI